MHCECFAWTIVSRKDGSFSVKPTSGIGPHLVVWNILLTLTIGTLICFWIWRQTVRSDAPRRFRRRKAVSPLRSATALQIVVPGRN